MWHDGRLCGYGESIGNVEHEGGATVAVEERSLPPPGTTVQEAGVGCSDY